MSNSPILYYVSFSQGAALVRARTEKQAERESIRIFGSLNGPYRVSVATDFEQAYVVAMGGKVHDATGGAP